MGMGPIYTQLTHPNAAVRQQQQQYQQQFDQSATAAIPGMASQYGMGPQPGMTVPGLLGEGPPQQQIPGVVPYAPPQQQPFSPNGMYGQQAMMLAGLLGRSGQGYPSGPLGGKRGPFRPGGK